MIALLDFGKHNFGRIEVVALALGVPPVARELLMREDYHIARRS